MVDIGQDITVLYSDSLTALYRDCEYREFLLSVPNTPIHRRPDNLYQMVEALTDTRRYPKEIAILARDILQEL